MSADTHTRSLHVLEHALRASSRSTRERAVAMLAHVECEERERWLRRADADACARVRTMAMLVAAWTMTAEGVPWPPRENARDLGASPIPGELLGLAEPFRWRWEYVVEVWREDGLPVGVFLAATCEEDDEHARRIALGQAVLAATSAGADRFEPERAAAFIVAKRQVRRGGPRRTG